MLHYTSHTTAMRRIGAGRRWPLVPLVCVPLASEPVPTWYYLHLQTCAGACMQHDPGTRRSFSTFFFPFTSNKSSYGSGDPPHPVGSDSSIYLMCHSSQKQGWLMNCLEGKHLRFPKGREGGTPHCVVCSLCRLSPSPFVSITHYQTTLTSALDLAFGFVVCYDARF